MWQCVVLNASATKNLWSVSIQSSCWHQRREFCAIFVKQFDFGLTYNNEISSVRLGREPNFFMHLFTLAFQWFATSHTWKISCFSPRIIQGIAKTYQFITVWWKFMCEQLPLFTEMKYLASRQNWNLQPLKVPDTNSWVVPSTCFKFRNWDVRCTIHRNKPIHKQYSDPWEIERSIFKLEVSLKPT